MKYTTPYILGYYVLGLVVKLDGYITWQLDQLDSAYKVEQASFVGRYIGFYALLSWCETDNKYEIIVLHEADGV